MCTVLTNVVVYHVLIFRRTSLFFVILTLKHSLAIFAYLFLQANFVIFLLIPMGLAYSEFID